MRYPHWYYWLSLVDDIDRLSRFVDLTTSNYATHSIELTRLLLAAGAEVDVVAKLLCRQADPKGKPGTLGECRDVLLPLYPSMPSIEVTIRRAGLTFIPWSDWRTSGRPVWWACYNNVKHERDTHQADANLGSVLSAVAGLCVLVCYLYYKDFVSAGRPTHRPFIYLDEKYKGKMHVLTSAGIHLPDFPAEPAPRKAPIPGALTSEMLRPESSTEIIGDANAGAKR